MQTKWRLEKFCMMKDEGVKAHFLPKCGQNKLNTNIN